MLFIERAPILLWIVITFLVFLGFTAIALSRHRDRSFSGSEERSVLVILPCKGVDYRFSENLESLKSLDYGNHRIVAVVDSMHDESVKYLQEAHIDVQVTSATCDGCSGKVRAIASVLSEDIEEEIIVVVDSDTMVSREWLRYLILPFEDPNVGVTTTFPVFVADAGFWSVVKTAWGMVGSGMMESRLTRFVWGGSMAFRKSLINTHSLEYFKRNVSDDVAIMRICRNAGLTIEYVRKASPRIHSNDNRRTFTEWSNRQTALSISGSPQVLRYGITFYTLQIFLLVSSILLSIFVYPYLILLIMPYFISASKNAGRAVSRKAGVFILTFILPFIYLSNLIRASGMRNIEWRGETYGLP